MADWFQGYIEQFKKLWKNLNKRARIVIGIGVLGVILFLIFLVIWNGSTQYQPLFSQLDPRDADAIIKNLDKVGISYQFADGGRTIMVPTESVYKTRLDMAGAGLPTQGVVGFEIFNDSKFGTTDFERKVNYYRALGGELSRTIEAMDIIDFTKVQITAPRESLFIEEEQPAEASVLLKLKPGYKIRETQVRAIANLVASSLQGLEVDKVTIVDTAGNLLSRNFNNDSLYNTQLTLNQFEIQRQFAEELKSDLRVLLTKVLGPDNYTIQVKTKLNFDQREIESKEYSPVVDEQGIIRSQQEQKENYKGDGATGGVPGTTSNNPQYQSLDGNSESGTYQSSNKTINYEINEKMERHLYASGNVERISVAVIVNDSSEPDEIEKIREVIQAAIGYDSKRGDLVTVTNLAFDNSLKQEMAQATYAQEAVQRTKMYIYAGLIALILIILLILFIVFRNSTKQVEEEIFPGKEINFMIDEDQAKEVAATELSEKQKKRQMMKKDLADIIADKPEEVAQILKSWLLDE